MIKCPNCNHDVSEESIFCPECGTRMSAPAPVQEPQEPVAPAAAVEAPAEAPVEAAAEPAKKAFSFAAVWAAVKKFFGKVKEVTNKVVDKIPLPKKVVAIIAIALAVILVAGIIVLIVVNANRTYPFALYVKDNDLYFSNLKKGKQVEIIDYEQGNSMAYYSGASAALNKSGSRLFYPEFDSDGTTLYYRDLNKKEAVKIDSGVTSYAINENGTAIVYMKEGNLYKSNLKDKEKIASDIGSFRVSKDLKKVLYTKEGALYFKNGNKDAEKIVSDASLVSCDSEKLAWMFYTKEGALYFQKPGKDDKIKVSENYNDFLVAMKDGKAYFTKTTSSNAKLWDFVEDDMAESDAAMKEPVYPEYPDYPDYPSRPWRSDFDTQEEYEIAYAEYEAEYERLQKAYDEAREKYYEDQDKYYEDSAKWNEKVNRDSLRETLKEMDYNKSSYELYYFDGKTAKLVTGDLANSWDFDWVTNEKGAVAAGSVEIRQGGAVGKVKLSEVNYYWQVEDQLNSGSAGALVTKLVWQDKVFDLNVEKVDSIRFSDDAKKIWVLADVNDEKNTGDLYEAKFSKSGMGNAKKIDTDVSTSGFTYSEGVGICYMKEYKDGKGDLYVKGKKIDFDVTSGGVAAFKGGYLYQSGKDLKYYKGGKATTIAEKVYNLAMYNEDTLVLLYDWSSEKGKGTLGVFTGGKKVTVLDEDVTRLINIAPTGIHNVYRY